MNWTKLVLMFQAVITLVIGLVFLVQVINLNAQDISKLKVDLGSGVTFGDGDALGIIDVKQRYTVAAYILLVVGLIEILILARLFSN
ncbi:MAG: hypothetical protein NUV97_04215 [archaeon]|nr:hypothetical protein [archaeon]MCR4323545.1 hypothetical protein [Nanoarchaeota archaeon]